MKWGYDTFTKFAYIRSFSVSPDGNSIAYHVQRLDLNGNARQDTLVLRDLKSDEEYFFDGFIDPLFSPSGDEILLKKVKDEETELFILHVGSKTLESLGKFRKLVDVDWCGNSKSLIIKLSKTMGDEDLYYEDDIPVWFDRVGFLDGRKDKILVFDISTRSTYLEMEEKNLQSVKWFEGKLLITTYNRRKPYTEYNVYLRSYDGKTEKLFEGVSFYPVDVKDGRILLLGKEKKRYTHEHDYLYILEDGKLTPLTEKYGLNNSPAMSLEMWHPSRMNTAKLIGTGDVFFLSMDSGRTLLERVKDGKKEKLIEENVVIPCIDVSEDGKIFFTAVMNGEPMELYTLRDGKLTRLTDLNDEMSKVYRFRKLNHFEYESLGLKIDGWYLKPDKTPAPMIVFVHGGPKGSYGYVPYLLGQLLADEGFYVLYTNPRGSNGYTEEFANVIGRVGMEDFEDIMNGVKRMIEIEDVDEGRLGITGISYGGFMTNVAITKSKIFKAAVSENGISNWFTSYTFSDIGFWFDKELISGDPLEDGKYVELSPIYHAKDVETPVLFIHSLEDFRCPLEQSLSFHTVLRDLGKESHIVVFKKGPHGHSVLGKPKHMLKRFKIIVEFFKSKLLTNERFEIEKVLSSE